MTIDVLVELGIKHNDGLFTYHVPSALESEIKLGIRVLVPFGKQQLEGFILNIYTAKTYDYELKDIINIIDDAPILNEELLALGKYIQDTYLSSLISAYQVMLPKALKAKEKVNINIKMDNYIELKQPLAIIQTYINNNFRAPKQNELLSRLIIEKIIKKTDFDHSVVNALMQKDLITLKPVVINRLSETSYDSNQQKPLTHDQQQVYDQIMLNTYHPYLLHGVTGSGKTEIYMQLIQTVLNEGKEAIVLVPEIALTPQIINLFKGRFTSQIAILHSRLSDGERYDEYRKIQNQEAKIVIGARSAIFAPFTNLGIIIIDEEHEATYKQENNPRYHAIDIAIKRAQYHQCPVILGSATPSLESYARAQKGVYQLLELKHRINNLKMPQVELVNMLNENKKSNFIFSDLLTTKIKDRLSKNEQIILLLNRRGYSNYLICANCGYVHKCPNCDISLTYHKSSHNLRCHYCGYSEAVINTCPHCHESALKNMGLGTERVEEELIKNFNARVLRMDLDTTTKKGAHQKILNQFKNHEYDILLGTQMIAKGLDFDKVTLVGVLNGDASLNIPDFRSSERTFQLISQVAGRSGRKTPGEVIIQSYNTDHYSILTAKNHDYLSFYNQELQIRHSLKYPPFYYLTLLKISGKDYDLIKLESQKIKNYLIKNLTPNNIVLGPTTASLYKINNVYRFQIIIKYKNNEELKSAINQIVDMYQHNYKINLDIDVNPLKL